LFIITGIIIILAAGAGLQFYSYYQQKAAPEVEKAVALPSVITSETLQGYVKSCIQKESSDLIKIMALNGGTLSLENYRYYAKDKYRYLCIQKDDSGKCISIIPTRQAMELELATVLQARLKYCIDLKSFEQQDFAVEEGDIEVKPKLRVDDVIIDVNYPFKLSKENQIFTVSQFSETISLPLGKLYELAVQIVNYELTNGLFDQDEWMLQHKSEILIEKHKPYPDIAYRLSKTVLPNNEQFVFNFAFQERDAVSEIGKILPENKNLGCCINSYDNTCFANSENSACSAINGNFVANKDCNCPGLVFYDYKTQASSCGDHDCRACVNGKNNGESWCEYDGPVGKGADYAGTRHYKKTCIDGIEYVEECADYRQEICVEQNVAGIGTKALCRANRWQDCSAQSNQKDCENQNNRDCLWLGYLHPDVKSYGLQRANKGCVPQVPPGFKFWQGQGANVCAVADEHRTCDGANCPSPWIDANAIFCNSLGDCGNKRNAADVISTRGYVNYNGVERAYTYMPDGLTKDTGNYALGLRLDALQMPALTGKEFANPGHTVADISKAQQDYIKEASSWDVNKFKLQYLTKGKIDAYIFAAAICSPWQAPSGGENCGLCNADPDKPCSEYKCRSLGATCKYSEQSGIGICSAVLAQDKNPPVLSFNERTLVNIAASPIILFGKYEGIELKPELKPDTKIILEIDTDKESQCRLNLLPENIEYAVPSSILQSYASFNSTEFVKEHFIVLNVPSQDKAYEGLNNLMKLFNKTDILQSYSIVSNYENELSKLGRELNYNTSANIEQAKAIIGTLNPEILREGSISLTGRQSKFFVKCNDANGNENIAYPVVFTIASESVNQTVS
jgi:hypothetical protein